MCKVKLDILEFSKKEKEKVDMEDISIICSIVSFLKKITIIDLNFNCYIVML